MERVTLPAILLIDKFIIGDPNSISYEHYLTEFVNCSEYFMKKGGSSYVWQSVQNDGQCDAVSSKYSIDFKLFGSESAIKAKRLLSPATIVHDGVLFDFLPKQLVGMNTTLAYNLLNSLSLEDLYLIDSGKYFDLPKAIKNDVKGLLKTLKVQKNLLLFSVDLILKSESDGDECLNIIRDIYDERLRSSLKFRMNNLMKSSKRYDTFFAFIFDGYFNIFECKEFHLVFIERIPLSKSGLFMRQYNYLSPEWKQRIIIS